MASGPQNQDVVLENLRKQLALAVRSIQWSYAIFWSISSKQPGVLEWSDGYYNGDIKTRKTVQSAELNVDHLGLQRSEQLRELYESLSEAETNSTQQAKRPSAALSPEDLTDTEWYYLVCMSFIFKIGEGLPGRTLEKDQIIWLSNAHQAESKVFSRSLLAKSASIQTVVCFPHLGGAVELGVTDLVTEDTDLVQHIKCAFLDNPYINISEIPYYVPDNGRTDISMRENDLDMLAEGEEEQISSPNNSTSGFEDDQYAEESHMLEDNNEDASQAQSWQFMDDDDSNYAHNSMNPSDCISQTYAYQGKPAPHCNKSRPNNEDNLHELHECNQKKLNSFGFRGDDVHYQGVLSTLLKTSHQLVLGPYFRNMNKESSFVSWSKERSKVTPTKYGGKQQRLLKKILFEVPKQYGNWMQESSANNGKRESICRPEADELDSSHVLAERKRRQKLNERFTLLGSLVPTNGKVDKVSLLDDTIDYLKELQRRVEELESYKEEMEREARTRRRNHGSKETTSSNYFRSRAGISKKPLISKRKASDVADTEPDDHCMLREISSDDLTVSVIDKNALIELKCPHSESVLLDILEAVSDLNLDSHSVQSANSDGILSITIKAKFKGRKVATPSIIRQAIQGIIRKNPTL